MPIIFFYFLKIIFDISTSKQFKKYKSHSILTKKNSKIDETQLQMQCQTDSKLLFNYCIFFQTIVQGILHNFKLLF